MEEKGYKKGSNGGEISAGLDYGGGGIQERDRRRRRRDKNGTLEKATGKALYVSVTREQSFIGSQLLRIFADFLYSVYH
jgi:hypothetical protein